MPPAEAAIVHIEVIASRIHLIRNQKVMLDRDLAELYLVPTKRLNEAVKRNRSRFPKDFMFQLNTKEVESLRSQIATSNSTERGGRRTNPYAFTEHGVAMLSSVLNSERAIKMNIQIIRAFIAMRDVLLQNRELAERVRALEENQAEHGSILSVLVEEIRKLQIGPERSRKAIGFPTSQIHH